MIAILPEITRSYIRVLIRRIASGRGVPIDFVGVVGLDFHGDLARLIRNSLPNSMNQA